MQMAIAYGGNPAAVSSSGLTVLHSIAYRNDVHLFNLVESELPSAIVNAQNDVGHTALHIALSDEYSPLTMHLACHPGIDVDIQDIWGLTALHLAIRNRRSDVAHALIQKGASFKLVSLHGENWLHLAVESGSVPITSMLMERGANMISNVTEFGSIFSWANCQGDSKTVARFRQLVFE
jgi:ankyrin repeat protein